MPISHRSYLVRLAALARILRTRKPSAVAFSVIGRDPRHEDLLWGIREHCETYCRRCFADDETFDASQRIPDAEGVALGACLEWIRLAYPRHRTAEVLSAENALSRTIRAVAMKYHPTRLPHELEAMLGAEMLPLLNEALDRLWPALRDYVPVPPPSRAERPRRT